MASDDDDCHVTTTTTISISEADEIRRRLLRSDRARLRSNVANLIRIIRKPLADVIRDHALPHLPVQSLHRLRCVSSSWNASISSPIFTHTHSYTHRSPSGFFSNSPSLSFVPFDPDSYSIPDPSLSFINRFPITVKSSSNGLALCLAGHDYVVCNPSTMEWTLLPARVIDHGDNPNAVLIFNPSALNCGSDYFVVVAFEIGVGAGVFGFDVFSSASGAWRASCDICYAEVIVDGSGISAGDVACWRTSMQTVVIYDPTADRACTVEWPMGYSVHVTWELGAVAGRLCCVAVTDKHVSVSVLRKGNTWGPREDYLVFVGRGNEGEGLWEWVKKECVEEESSEVLRGELRPLRSQSGNFDVVVMTDEGVVVLDLVGRRVRQACGVPTANWEMDLVPHINTLVPVYPQDRSMLRSNAKLHES